MRAEWEYAGSRGEDRQRPSALRLPVVLLSVLLSVMITVLASACVAKPSGTTAVTSHRARTTAPRVRHPATVKPAAVPAFDKHAHSVTRAGSIWVIVNKKHPLDPISYEPKMTIVEGRQVDHRIAPQLNRLLAGANRAGNPLHVVSGWRSYAYQQSVFDGLVYQQGRAAAQKWSAKPGYSEHQTGLAVDLDLAGNPACSLQSCFGKTRGGRWLAANAWRYGFIIRYTKANKAVTGYSPEPWHIRYVGKSLARELRAVHADSLETFFGVSGGN
ncbi:MAG: M15 family metallopeptidase [Microlunatus sp.]|nr:M15 family metallopeptidase [Microlunatus sp.]